MSTVLNSPRKAGRPMAWACLFGLLALAAFGCSDHGPVGIFSPELFHKNVNGPVLNFYSATQISFTVQGDPSADASNLVAESYNVYPYNTTYNGNALSIPNLSVVVVNSGGSGTYGPLQTTFSAPGYTGTGDPFIIMFEGNDAGSGAWVSPQGGQDPSSNDWGTAISNLASGSEVGAFNQTPVTLYQGYFTNNNQNANYVDDSQYMSVAFIVSPSTAGDYSSWNDQVDTVPIEVTIKDGIGDPAFTSWFNIYITLTPP